MKRSDFLAANQGLRIVTSGFILLVRTDSCAHDTMRMGVTVTKKIGNAVVRNRVKRRFRALMRQILPEHGIPAADHILIGRAQGIERDFATLQDDLVRALERIRSGKTDRKPDFKRRPHSRRKAAR
nr:ribonuclease P protein component [Sphingorhabdus sp. Alg239-R122]